MFTRRTSAQVAPICVRVVVTAPPTLYIKSCCELNTSPMRTLRLKSLICIQSVVRASDRKEKGT